MWIYSLCFSFIKVDLGSLENLKIKLLFFNLQEGNAYSKDEKHSLIGPIINLFLVMNDMLYIK